MKRLLIIFGFVVLALWGAWFALLQMGKLRTYAPLDSPFLKLSAPVVVLPLKIVSFDTFKKYNFSLNQLQKKFYYLKKEFSTLVFSLDVTLNSENKMVLETFPSLLLTKILKNNKTPFVLNLKHKDPARWFFLKEKITTLKQSSLMALSSPFVPPLRYLREEKPLWTYVVPQPKLTRMLLFQSFFLEPLISIDEDILIAPLVLNHQLFLSPRFLKEAHRQKKKVILLWNKPLSEVPPSVKKDLFGVLTEKPALLLKK